jgi:hypothetical protein
MRLRPSVIAIRTIKLVDVAEGKFEPGNIRR